MSVLVIDDLERLIEYVPAIPVRFSNGMLQVAPCVFCFSKRFNAETLLFSLQSLSVLLRRPPPKVGCDVRLGARSRSERVGALQGHRLLVIGATAARKALKELQLDEAFDASVQVPEISTPTELKAFLADKLVAAFDGDALARVTASFPDGCHVGVKKLIMLVEMARQGKPDAVADRFIDLLRDYALKKF